MNSIQRIKAALAGHFPDTTPILLHNFLMAVKEAGITHGQYRESPELIAKTHLQAAESYGLDGVLIDLDTVVLSGALGVPVDLPDDFPARSHEALISSLEEVDNLPFSPDISHYKYVQIVLEAARVLVKSAGNQLYIRGNCDQAAFSLACSLRTPAEFLMDIMDPDNAERVHRLLDYCCRAACQFIQQMAQTGVPMTSNGDSPAGPAMISPAMYCEFALPYEQRIAAAAKAAGTDYMLHICGDTGIILDDLVKVGASAYELDYKTDINDIHRIIGPAAAFSGNIDPTGVLVYGSPELVAEKTRELLNVYRDNPRFILNAGCAIPAETPPENLKAMIRTAREFYR